MRRITHLVVHCSAEPMGRPTTAATIRSWHMAKGWADIGYHYVIRSDGKVEAGRKEERVGAHVEGHNSNTIGICLIGGLDPVTWQPSSGFAPVQQTALVALLRDLRTRYPNAAILGHRDFPNVAKACPCFNVKPWAQSVGLNPL